MSKFKRGDKVTQDPNTKSSLKHHIGEIFTIVNVRRNSSGEISIDVDRPSISQTSTGWREDVWILAKNQIIHDIIKDL